MYIIKKKFQIQVQTEWWLPQGKEEVGVGGREDKRKVGKIRGGQRRLDFRWGAQNRLYRWCIIKLFT